MNLIRNRTPAVAVAALAIVAGLSACKKSDQSADTAAVVRDSAAGIAAAPASAMAPAPTWSDAAILGFAHNANTGEVALGRLAQTKATSASVKSFARQMVADHEAMHADVNALSAKLGIVGDTTSGDALDLLNRGRDEMKDLTEKAAETDWDKNYIDKMIEDHQKVLDKLQDAAKNTMNTEIRAALEKATGKVQMHLTKAKDIKANQLKS